MSPLGHICLLYCTDSEKEALRDNSHFEVGWQDWERLAGKPEVVNSIVWLPFQPENDF